MKTRIKTQHLIIGAVAIVGAWFVLTRGRALAKVIATKINPASRENIIYQAVGEPGFKFADWFKSDAEKAVDRMLAPAELRTQETTTRTIANSWDQLPRSL